MYNYSQAHQAKASDNLDWLERLRYYSNYSLLIINFMP